MCRNSLPSGGVGYFEPRRKGSSQCQYIDTTGKAIDCATTLPLTVFGRPFSPYAIGRCLSACDVGVLWPNGLTDQDMKLGTQVGLSPGHIVLDGDPALLLGPGAQPPIFGPYPLRSNGCIHQDSTWYGVGLGPGRLCGVRWGSSPLPKKWAEPLPNFWPISIVAKWLDAPRCHLVWS